MNPRAFAVLLAASAVSAMGTAAPGTAHASVCRMYLTNPVRVDPPDAPPSPDDKKARAQKDKQRLGDAAATVSASPLAAALGGIQFKDEVVSVPGGPQREFRSAEVQCTAQTARGLSSWLHDSFTPAPGSEAQIQFGFEFLENPPNIKHDTLAADFLARRTAKALEAVCKESGAACDFSGVPLDGIDAAVRQRCGDPNSADCGQLHSALEKQDAELRDAPTAAGFEFTGSSLEGLVLPAKYLHPLAPPPSPGMVAAQGTAGTPTPGYWDSFTNWAGRQWNNTVSAGRQIRDIWNGDRPWKQPTGYTPGPVAPYKGTEFKDFDAPFRQSEKGPARDIHILSPFGAARDGGARSHQGVDISCKHRGEPVYAGFDGTIEGWRIGYAGISGNRVWIDHGNVNGAHLETFFVHLDRIDVRGGQAVKKGDQIGLCGMTGNAAGLPPSAVHLHYECHANGPAINPDPACFPNAKKI